MDTFSMPTLVGEYVWGVEVGYGQVLRMNFGTPFLRVIEPRSTDSEDERVRNALRRRKVIPTGKWEIFMGDGTWSLHSNDHIITRYKDQEGADSAVQDLSGQILVSYSINTQTKALKMTFDLGAEVHVCCSENDGEEDWSTRGQWTIFIQDGGALTMQSDGEMIYEN